MVDEQISDNQDQSFSSEPAVTSNSSDERRYTKDDLTRVVRKELYDYKQKHAEPERNRDSSSQSFLSHEDVKRLAAEEANRMFEDRQRQYEEQVAEAKRQEVLNNAQKTVQSFYSQVELAAAKYSDFDEVVDRGSFGNTAHFMPMLEKTGMAGDLLHYLGNKPSELSEISELARVNRLAAQKKIDEISNSLKLKEAASKVVRANEPLDHMQQSNIGIGSGSGNPDYSNKSWAKW